MARLGVELVPGDVTDPGAVRTMLEGADGVFHVADWYHVGGPDSSPAYRVNVEGTRTVLEQMRAADVPRGVYTSTLAVNSDTRGRIVDETSSRCCRESSTAPATPARRARCCAR
ncbi:MAG TPA: NAD(P)H-binding protein [Actinomycetales bacterium]|nr:NAD(P)H-binding protein [Actinomycetales bacterium]